MTQNRQLMLIAGLAAGIVIVGTWDRLYETVFGKHRSQAQVRALAEKLELGMTRADVRQLTRHADFDKLTLHEDRDAWVIRTPMILGAQEWLVVVTFASGRVNGIGIRIADSLRIRPEGAPADKGWIGVRGDT